MTLEAGTINGQFSDTTGTGLSYEYTLSGGYVDGQWAPGGTARVTQDGDGSWSYSDSGALVSAGEGWTASGIVMDSASHQARWSYTIPWTLDSEGQWASESLGSDR